MIMRSVLRKSYDISETLTCVTGLVIEAGALVPRMGLTHIDSPSVIFSEEAWRDFLKWKPLIEKYFSTKGVGTAEFPVKEGNKNPLMIHDHEIFFHVSDWKKAIQIKSKYSWVFVDVDESIFEKLMGFEQDIMEHLQKLGKEVDSHNKCMEKLIDLVANTMSANLEKDAQFYRKWQPRRDKIWPIPTLFDARDIHEECRKIEVEEPLVSELIRIFPDFLSHEILMNIEEPDLIELTRISSDCNSRDVPY